MQEIRRKNRPDVVVVPESVINDTKITLTDLGIYVQLAHLLELYVPPHEEDEMVNRLVEALEGQPHTDPQLIRASVRHLIDAGHLWLTPRQ
ncbi:hypothetical protein ACH4CE_35355 [Streptomyces gelaticus]|uniref:hypothetical protein n=1 Tax=Streptomyces gelaticus TaxID=285446 RepID=UPI0037A6593E